MPRPIAPVRPGSQRIRLVSSLAMLALAIGGVWFYSVHTTAQLFDMGINAHADCGIHADPAHPLPQSGLADAIASRVAAAVRNSQVAAKGVCSAAGRDYTDVVVRLGTAKLSIALTPHTENEVFPRALSGKVIDSIHFGDRGGYAVAGFEQGQYLAFVVSNLPDDPFEQVVMQVVPVIREAAVQ